MPVCLEHLLILEGTEGTDETETTTEGTTEETTTGPEQCADKLQKYEFELNLNLKSRFSVVLSG